MSDITIVAGDDYNFKLVYKDAARVIIDLTGATARMMVRKSYYMTPKITKVATVDGPAGSVLFDFDPLDTEGLVTTGSQVDFIFDVELTGSSGDITTIQDGKFIVKQAVTRD